ncbi:FBX36 protein, partial [Polypterus senegalus]|nr:FBX36 protein [Polypterus senegalus]
MASLLSETLFDVSGQAPSPSKDFYQLIVTKTDVNLVFGKNIVDYVQNLCQGNFDYLERLPDPLLLHIISFLDLEDLARLSQTSHKFEKLCSSDELWENIVESSCDTVTPEMRALAAEMGWKQIFFTNKLQLQMRIRRRRQNQESVTDEK